MDYTKVVIEADARGRLSIAAESDDGSGEGKRLAGPKYVLGGTDPIVRVELTERNVEDIRYYLGIWDGIQGGGGQR